MAGHKNEQFKGYIKCMCIGPKKIPCMDELGLTSLSTVFQSYRDDGRVNMKGSVQ